MANYEDQSREDSTGSLPDIQSETKGKDMSRLTYAMVRNPANGGLYLKHSGAGTRS